MLVLTVPLLHVAGSAKAGKLKGDASYFCLLDPDGDVLLSDSKVFNSLTGERVWCRPDSFRGRYFANEVSLLHQQDARHTEPPCALEDFA